MGQWVNIGYVICLFSQFAADTLSFRDIIPLIGRIKVSLPFG